MYEHTLTHLHTHIHTRALNGGKTTNFKQNRTEPKPLRPQRAAHCLRPNGDVFQKHIVDLQLSHRNERKDKQSKGFATKPAPPNRFGLHSQRAPLICKILEMRYCWNAKKFQTFFSCFSSFRLFGFYVILIEQRWNFQYWRRRSVTYGG